MFDLTRRHAIKLLGSAAALSFTASPSAASIMPSTGQSLFDEVAFKAAKFHREESEVLLRGLYQELFRHTPSTMAVENVVRTRFPDLGHHVRVHDQPRFESNRFIWNFEPEEFGLGFYVVRDDDPRASDADPKKRIAKVSDLSKMLRALASSFKEMREIDAWDVLNNGHVYDAAIGADGVSMCSANHPHDRGVWSNAMNAPLDRDTLLKAIVGIGSFVDDGGNRIMARPDKLVVPIGLMDVAERITKTELRPGMAHGEDAEPKQHYIWSDYLTSMQNWFVTTNISGLVWFESQSFAITCEYDKDKDAVLITGSEKRKFGCHDPRAIFGSFPDKAARGTRQMMEA